MINHTITVRNRRIKVDTPRLIQGCAGSDAYHVGDKITYNGKHYTCVYDGCVWTPDAYPQGWQLAE